MNQNININEVRQYNASLKQYRDKAAQLKAEIEYTNNEINELCKELSAELGIEVTRENINQVYEEQINKIDMALKSGVAVLSKIQEGEQQIAQQAQEQQAEVVETTVIANQAPVDFSGVSTTPVQAPTPPSFAVPNNLPPMFS